jgi:hypothetical protein
MSKILKMLKATRGRAVELDLGASCGRERVNFGAHLASGI